MDNNGAGRWRLDCAVVRPSYGRILRRFRKKLFVLFETIFRVARVPGTMQHEVLLRRTGTVPNAGVRNGPGSAAHRYANAARCAASGARKHPTALIPANRRLDESPI